MARETKVGLIVGLGVILFVSVFVSDYLSTPEPAQGEYDALADFQNQTTNQPELLIRPGQIEPEPMDTSQLAAASLEQIERRHGTPRPIDEHIVEPPFRRAGPELIAMGEETTPLAIDPDRRAAPGPVVIGTRIDDPALARGNQLDRQRLELDRPRGLDPIAHVEIPDPPAINRRPRVVEHTVAAGENLTKIARQHYNGDGNMWRSIRDANPGKVGPNGEVLLGAVLVIPKRSTEQADEIETLTTGGDGTGRPQRQRVRMVTVKEGQTVSAIAYEQLGAANKYPLIMAVNPELEKPEHLRAGMKLRIPAEDTARLIEEAETALAAGQGDTQPDAQPDFPPAETNTYTVKSGDNLTKIAKKMLGDGNRYDEIYQVNKDKLSSPDAVQVGMVLKMPAR